MSFASVALLVAFLFNAPSAQACSRSEQQLICPGDYVVGHNSSTNRSWPGRAMAVNPFSQKISILHDDGDVATWNLADVSVGAGCIQGYCVGDRAVGWNSSTNRSWPGRIAAINPFSQKISILHDDGDLATWSIDSVSIGYGCIYGYCVGDGAVGFNSSTNRSWPGRIVGVNPFENKITILHDDGDTATWDLTSVSNSNYCADYGSLERKGARYPFFNERSYSIPRYKWHPGRR